MSFPYFPDDEVLLVELDELLELLELVELDDGVAGDAAGVLDFPAAAASLVAGRDGGSECEVLARESVR
jgi:hypothetical protein